MSLPTEMPSTLRLLELVTSRLSHALRTPLGVALGVISDHCSGLPCQPEDFEDARGSLKQIQAALDILRDISRSLETETEHGDLRIVAARLGIPEPDSGAGGNDQFASLPIAPAETALRLLMSALNPPTSSGQTNIEHAPQLTKQTIGDARRWIIELPAPLFKCASPSRSLREAAAGNHSLTGIVLAFTSELFTAYGGSGDLLQRNGSTLFRVWL